MLRGTDLGLQISAGHHLQSRREKKNVSSLKQNFPVSLMGLRNKNRFLFLRKLIPPQAAQAPAGNAWEAPRKTQATFLLQILEKPLKNIRGLRVFFQDHLWTPVLLQLTKANTSKDSWALPGPAFPHPDPALQSKGVSNPVHHCLGEAGALQGWHPCLTPSRGITVLLTLVHDDWAALSSCNSRVQSKHPKKH